MSSRVCCAVALAIAAPFSHAGITIDVIPSSAPNAYGSPSWGAYVGNALGAIEAGLSSVGNRLTDPTAYEVCPSIVDPGEFMVSSFKSWRGTVGPAAPFDNEYGNRVHFGLHAFGDGVMQFRLEDLTFELHSNDSFDSLGYVGNFIGYNYSPTRFGVDWGADRQKGGGDDTYYASGNGTTLVDEIVYVGVGNAFWPGGSDPDPANPIGGAQAAMDDAYAYVYNNVPFVFSGSYTILGHTASGSVTVIPAPGIGSALAAMLVFGARRRRGA